MIPTVIPTVGLEGKFKFHPPFESNDTLTLKVTGLRTISDYIEVGRNLLTGVYIPAGLTEEDYISDTRKSVPIVTFVTLQRKTIHIPANRIIKIPSRNTDDSVGFHWFQAIVSLGLLPESFDTSVIDDAIRTSVSTHIGIEPNVYVTVASTMDSIDLAAAELSEAARVAAVTYKSTLLKDKMDLETKLAAARAQIEELIQVIEDMP